jgi:hypothetical protein
MRVRGWRIDADDHPARVVAVAREVVDVGDLAAPPAQGGQHAYEDVGAVVDVELYGQHVGRVLLVPVR